MDVMIVCLLVIRKQISVQRWVKCEHYSSTTTLT